MGLDGAIAAYASVRGPITKLATLNGILAVAYEACPPGLVGVGAGFISVFNAEGGSVDLAVPDRPYAHKRPISSIALYPQPDSDGPPFIVSGAMDGSLVVWTFSADVGTWRPLVLDGHQLAIYGSEYLGGSLIYTVGEGPSPLLDPSLPLPLDSVCPHILLSLLFRPLPPTILSASCSCPSAPALPPRTMQTKRLWCGTWPTEADEGEPSSPATATSPSQTAPSWCVSSPAPKPGAPQGRPSLPLSLAHPRPLTWVSLRSFIQSFCPSVFLPLFAGAQGIESWSSPDDKSYLVVGSYSNSIVLYEVLPDGSIVCAGFCDPFPSKPLLSFTLIEFNSFEVPFVISGHEVRTKTDFGIPTPPTHTCSCSPSLRLALAFVDGEAVGSLPLNSLTPNPRSIPDCAVHPIARLLVRFLWLSTEG